MPNKAIRHTELDHAIEASLSSSKVKAKLDWKEIENILLKKTEPATSPLNNYSYSLNSIAAVISVNTSDYFKSTVFFAKRWATAIYLIAGSLIVITGTYFIYDFSRVRVHEKEITNKTTSVTVQTKGPEKITTASSATERSANNEASTGKEGVQPELNAGSSTELKEASRPELNEGNKSSANEAAESQVNARVKPGDNVDNKSDIRNEIKSEAPDFSRESTREAFDGTKEAPSQSKESSALKTSSGQKESSTLEDDKKAKVLYYKENLSLDKLEQQLTTDKKDSLK